MTVVLAGGRIPAVSAFGVSGVDGLVDVVLDEGRISAVQPAGTATDVGTVERIPLDGRWVVPGLWDQHVHFTQWAQTARRLDVSRAASAAEAAALVRERAVRERAAGASGASGDDVLVGFGFHDALWPDEPTRSLLDAATDRPVVLIAGDLHCSWLNSAAARRFAPGTPDAVLREDASFAVTSLLTAADDATLDRWAADAARAAATRGVVGIVDLEYGWNLDVWMRRMGAGGGRGGDGVGRNGGEGDAAGLRVEFGIYGEHLDRAAGLGLRTGAAIPGTGGLLTVGPFKVISDGSLNTRTALCSHAYPDGGHGVANLTPAELVERMRFAVDHGLEPAVHAIGDEANRRALDAFAAISAGGRIEHAQLIDPADVPRFARLGVTASVQPEHAMDDRDVADRLWQGRSGRAFPLADLHAAGARLAFGSDAPVAPLDPWAAIASAVGRTRDGREPWHPEQAIPADVALRASTRSTLSPGQPADLAVLDRDPLAASPDELRTMPVATTLLAGRVTHDALR
ncbi:amidohydrolase family protein [Leifsonia shinshuensis]|uniref:amidohydrolase n=1 Tax=Leifsonia shinshuensis TaxID=150026 RepID=UPI00285F9BC2|nr:amidohydrolase family protein [Leifsonia shinshuensis]MDR6970337.1 putative amidohydrolase YtcJ [Leifsonia shinshuensis]